DAVAAVNARVEEMLRAENPQSVIDRQEYCPFHPDATIERYRQESDLRKPKPGMILRAADKLALDLRESWVVGDAPRDVEAGKAAGCRTILFQPEAVAPSPAALAARAVEPDYVVTTLGEALDYIARSNRRVPTSAAERSREETKPGHDAATTVASVAPAPRSTVSPKESSVPTTTSSDLAKLLNVSEQILVELRRRTVEPLDNFSVPKLLAGIIQILALAILFVAYLNRSGDNLLTMIFVAQFLQMLTIALLIMERQ